MKKTLIAAIFFLFLFCVFATPQEKKDFTLPEIVNLGINNNPTLLAKAQEVAAKKAAFQASKRLDNPELEVHVGEGKLHDTAEKRNTDGISLSQYVENPFKRHHRIQMFEKEWQASEYFFHFSRLDITYEIKHLFYKVLLLKNKKELAQKNLSSLQETHQLILKRVNLGETKELEAIKLYVETLKARNELNRTDTELRLAKENLNKFLGNSLPSDFTVIGKLDYRPLEIDEDALLEKALLSHPLIKGKEKSLEFAESNLSYVKWQRLPDFKLSGFIHDELDGQNKGVGISLDIPLWNFKSKEIAEAESLQQKENQEIRALRMEISTEVKARLNEQRLSEQTIQLFHEGLLKQAEESLKISAESYKQGEISLIDYLDSQRTYNSILKDYQDSLYAWNTNKAALEKATGEEIK
ncbi:MAG: TolC family protein [Candidatus Aminicenantes bacterium]|nr:MAG: TolC family protein [Candidatus Aminicenantes bacterium]